eukprot:CAMPEP_0185575694 /NCGR_PEP_ID=MMETSP0434-20130131/6817_1 /TAXON_ID=626734 ORGANISM="Favella taraikaensis, Strain Fe Narragansett Bay" /NCGR_SAMPLE_ID=MMETSP0434 /ASSEMBLY_ACC=CAM_ASM_000379 /LENGTH=189 /DNA_ID=CAMNT_0028192639 /DNA_START=364 /DNA_END=936 /DNA_ORIENTATION=+
MTLNTALCITNSERYGYTNFNLWLAFDISNSVYCVITLMLNCTILATYVRFSNKLNRATARKATKSLRRAVGDSDRLLLQSENDSPSHSDMAAERVRASKRLSAYREMADRQIQEILATMITISNVPDHLKADSQDDDNDDDRSETESNSEESMSDIGRSRDDGVSEVVTTSYNDVSELVPEQDSEYLF